MSQATSSSAGNVELGATFLVTTAGNSKYIRIWRKPLYIGYLTSVKKRTASVGSHVHEWPQSPLSSVPDTSLSPARTSSSKSYHAINMEEEDNEGRIKTNIGRIVKEEDLKSLQDLGGVDFVASVLGRPPQPPEGDGNVIMPLPVIGTNLSKFLLNSIKSYRYTIVMLFISAGLSFAIDFKQEGPKHGWHDGVAIIFAVLLLVAGNSVANFVRERKLLKLAKRKGELRFKVKRGEESLMVPLSNIEVGDTVFLWPGDEVPAHGLLVSDDILVLQGEPEAIKRKHDNPFLLYGSKVIGGKGRMVITSVETTTNLAEMSSCNPERKRLLERLIEKPNSYIDIAALSISVLVAIVVLSRLICGKDGNNDELPEMKGNLSISMLMNALKRVFLRPQGSVSVVVGLVSLAILCVRHGFPLVVTISLKYQIDKVVPNQDAVLNDLSACTTMGLVTVICIDVSGELMSKPMEVSEVRMGEETISMFEVDKTVLDMLKQGVGVSVLAPEIFLSPLSNSLVSWAETWEMNMRSFMEENVVILKHTKLDSGKEGSGVLVRKVGDNQQAQHLHWIGAASTILDMCSHYYDSTGERHAMESHKTRFRHVIKQMEDSELKPIALAYKQTDGEEPEQERLTLLGLIGFKDTFQESIKSALENLESAANVKIKLVLEDDIMDVKEIARELGLKGDGIVLEGKEFQELNDKARLDKVDQAFVMGRFSPQDKLLMVQCLQEKGKVVAFIGTGLMINHTSVLNVADVGIAYDSLRTVVDRDNCDMSIKCFSALEPIVMAGRRKYHNIQKFIQLQLTCTISGLAITMITACTGDSPLSTFQMIWVNFLLCFLGGLMTVMKLRGTESKQPSDHRSQPMITKELWKDIAIQVLYQTSVSMILEFGHVSDQWEKKLRETMIFNTFLLCQFVNLLSTMQLLKIEGFVQSFGFLGVLVCCLLMQVVVIKYAKGFADCVQLNGRRWGICVLLGVLAWVFEWTLKNIIAFIRNATTNYAPQSITSRSFYLSPAFPFLMLLVLPAGLIFSQITFQQ